jgi:hypothetical protein
VKRVSEGYFMVTGVSPRDIGGMGAKIKEEIMDYLQTKVEQLRAAGIEKVPFVAAEDEERSRSLTWRKEHRLKDESSIDVRSFYL